MTTPGQRPSRPGGRRLASTAAAWVLERPLLRRLGHTPLGRRARQAGAVQGVVRGLQRLSALTRLDRAASRDAHAAPGLADARFAPGAGTRFLIVGQARTGSNLLQFELDRRWPEIRCEGERYRPDLRDSGASAEVVSASVFRLGGRETICGCKVFYNHLDPAEWQQVLQLDGLRVVHLRRRNLLRRFVSLRIAAENQVWTRYRGERGVELGDRVVHVDIEQFVRDCEASEEAYEEMERRLASSGVPVLDVWYEDLVEDLDGECRRVAAFLGAGPPRFGGRPPIARQNPEPLSRLVTNYDEVRGVLSKTALHAFLEDDDPVDGPSGRRRVAAPRSCWPTPAQELLLAAALAPPERAAERLAAWERVVGGTTVDDGSRRLFPLLYRTLRRASVESTRAPELKRSYVDASVHNQRLFRTLDDVLAGLEAAAVPALVLKGAALTVAYYRDRGVRPMADLDLMVPRDRVETAITALRSDRWELVGRRAHRPITELLRVRHSVLLRRDQDQLDLHWDPFAESLGTDLADRLWADSRVLRIGDRRTGTLAPADHLLHAFVHGLRYNPIPPLRWVADAHVTIRAASDDVDWERLTALAEQYRLAAPVQAAVHFLDHHFPDLLPPSAVRHVAGLAVTREERRAFDHGTRAHWLVGSGAVLWRAHRRREPDAGIGRSLAGFLDDLRILYDLDHVRQLPGHVVGGVWRRRHDRRSA